MSIMDEYIRNICELPVSLLAVLTMTLLAGLIISINCMKKRRYN